MGIPGLLQGLKSYTQPGNIRDFRGQNIAVDASSWLHKSIYPIAEHFVEATWGNSMDNDNAQLQQQQAPSLSVDTVADAHSVQVSTDYMLKRCQELIQYAGIKHIYLVIDGQRCPLKAGTNAERERKRKEHLNEARKYRKLLKQQQQQSSSNQQLQKQYREQMFHHYKVCIKVTQALADAVAAKLQRYCSSQQQHHRNANGVCAIELVFAPYEADAQLVQLVMAGCAQAVVTEDSDVLVYSAACQYAFPTLFKLDRQSGSCQIISMDFLLVNGNSSSGSNNNNTTAASRKKQQHQPTRRSALLPMTAEERQQEIDKKASSNNSQLENILSCFAEKQGHDPGRGSRLFVQACILTGCDYAPNLLQGIGLVSAFKHVRSCMHKSPDQRFRQVLKSLPPKAKRGLLLLQQQQFQRTDNNNTLSSSSSSGMDAYEELLAKSEAVFYYHPVLDTVSHRVMFFTQPITTSATNTTRRTTTDRNSNQHDSVNNSGHFRPSLARFHGDWSFLSNNPQDYHDYLVQKPSAPVHDDDDDDDDTRDSWFMRPTTTTTRPSSHSLSLFTLSNRQHLLGAANKPGAVSTNGPRTPLAATNTAQSSKKKKDKTCDVPPFVVMTNPYRRTNKRTNQDNNNDNNHDGEHDNRPEKRKCGGPLAPKSPNLESKKKKHKKNTRKEQQQQKGGRHPSKNLFAKFAAHKHNEKENPSSSSDDDDNGGGKQHHNLQTLFNNRRESADVRFVKPRFDENGNRIVLAAAASTAAAPNKQPAAAASMFSSQHVPLPPSSFGDDDLGQHHHQQQEYDFASTRQEQQQETLLFMPSRHSESESNHFSQRTRQRQQQQQQECSSSSFIRDHHDSRIIVEQLPPFGNDEREEENVSECINDANRQWQQEPPSLFLEPTSSTTHCSGFKENPLLPLVSSEEGCFDYDEKEQIEKSNNHPKYYSSTQVAAPTASLHGDNAQVNDGFYGDSTVQKHHSTVFSSRPLFARDAHAFLTGLDFEDDNKELADNFNDCMTAPPPFRNPPFLGNDSGINLGTAHTALSSRSTPMGLHYADDEYEFGNDNVIDLTETSCHPFENPAFCANENEEPTTTRSDYFARPRLGNGFSRRVTLESPTQQPTATTTLTAGRRLQKNPIFQPDLPRPVPFDLYDDFLSPKKMPPADENIDDSPPPNFGNRHHHHHHGIGQHGVSLSLNLYSQQSQQSAAAAPPKPKSTIGPAKTLRKRFKSCGTVNTNNNPLARAFERQRQIAAFEGKSTNSNSISCSSRGRAGGVQQQEAAQQRQRSTTNLNQSTLMFSFSSTSQHRT